jgi:hypothetical protein
MNDGAIMKMKFDVTYGLDYKLDIIISEGAWKNDASLPMKIDLNRLVFPLLMLIVLMYTVRFFICPSFKLSIHNQCLNVDLVSPTYITDNRLECCKVPDHSVYAGDTMKSSFVIKSRNESYGILIYRLQRRQLHENAKTNEDITNAAYLLIVWRILKFRGLYADVLLVKHKKGFDLDKDDLKELYHENTNRFKLYSNFTIDAWSLDDNTTLMASFEIINGDRILNITLSEVEMYNHTRAPIHINPKR